MKKIEDIRKSMGYIGRPINGCHYLDSHFRNHLDKRCIIYQDKDQSYRDFMSDVGAWIETLKAQGIGRGDRVLVLLPLRLELYQLMCALFYLGAVVVSVDSTMPKDKLKLALVDAKADAIFSVAELFKWTPFIPALWKLKRFSFDQRCLFSKDLLKIRKSNTLDFTQTPIEENGPTLISFTSGSTGRPKAANRSLEIFLAQKIVSEYFWQHQEDEVDMPFFPTLVLQNLGLGITTIFPDLDFRKIKEFDPAKVVKQMNDYSVTRFSATPMIIKKLANYILESGTKIPSLKSIIIGGAEITRKHARVVNDAFNSACENIDIHIIYGSTEVEPISFAPIDEYIESHEIGLNLGQVIDVLDIKTIDNISAFDFDQGIEWGEICLSGPHVIREYIDDHPANKTTKLKDERGVLWHLTGDVGYVRDGRVYLLGRLKDCLKVAGKLIPTFHYENELADIELVERCALVQAEDEKIHCFVEGPLSTHGQVLDYLKFKGLADVVIHKKVIPVDSRHFSRVNRSELREEVNS